MCWRQKVKGLEKTIHTKEIERRRKILHEEKLEQRRQKRQAATGVAKANVANQEAKGSNQAKAEKVPVTSASTTNKKRKSSSNADKLNGKAPNQKKTKLGVVKDEKPDGFSVGEVVSDLDFTTKKKKPVDNSMAKSKTTVNAGNEGAAKPNKTKKSKKEKKSSNKKRKLSTEETKVFVRYEELVIKLKKLLPNIDEKSKKMIKRTLRTIAKESMKDYMTENIIAKSNIVHMLNNCLKMDSIKKDGDIVKWVGGVLNVLRSLRK